MLPTLFLLLFASPLLIVVAQQSVTASRITVTGSVFCDVCFNNSFTQHSYFLPGADVHVRCKFQANAPETSEKFTFSVNRTTNRYGVYRLDIPSVEGVDCVEGPAMEPFCEASLIGSSVSSCSVPGVSTTSKEITVKSRSTNLCVYGISALSYRPFNRNSTLCGNYDIQENLLSDSFNSSKFFLPYFPWPLPQFPPLPSLPPLPPLPQLPPLPKLPPFPSFPPLPPFSSFPPFQLPPLSPLPQLPPLPPLPRLPPLPPLTSSPPQPPSNFPPFSKPPGFNPGDPRTWIPNTPLSNPPPPPLPGFDLRDPRTWIPTFPPSPNSPQSQQP